MGSDRSSSVEITGKTGAKPGTDYASLTSHPNQKLAEEGWKFWSGVEFHFIQSSFGWSMPTKPNTSFGNYRHWSLIIFQLNQYKMCLLLIAINVLM